MSLFTGAALLGAALVGAGGAAVAAHESSSATKDAAASSLKSNEDTLAFEKQQAEAAYQSNESTRKANYDQWAAREGTIAGVAGQHGLNVNIPGYVPSVDPNLNGTIAGATGAGQTAPASPGASGALPAVDPSKGDIGAQVAAYYKSRGTTPLPTSVQYWVSKWPELVARGQEIGNPNYANMRLSQAQEFGGGAPTGSIAGTMAPSSAPLGASAAPLQYKPGSIGATLQRF